MARPVDIRVDAWLAMLSSINDAAPGYPGSFAILSLVQSAATATQANLDALTGDWYINVASLPVKAELAMLRSRLDSYDTALSAVAGDVTAAQVDTAEYIRLALLTGQQRPPYPPLRMPDAALAASLWNQSSQVLALDQEQTGALPLPESASVKVREWLTNTAHELEASAPGEPLTTRDKVIGAIDSAKARVGDLLAQAGGILPRVLMFVGIGTGIVLAAWLLWRLSNRSK